MIQSLSGACFLEQFSDLTFGKVPVGGRYQIDDLGAASLERDPLLVPVLESVGR
jgi:hypothetical protein